MIEEYRTGDQPCPICHGWDAGETVVIEDRRFHKDCLRAEFCHNLLTVKTDP